jgi:hypothetical protein
MFFLTGFKENYVLPDGFPEASLSKLSLAKNLSLATQNIELYIFFVYICPQESTL